MPRYLIVSRFSVQESEMPTVGRRSREIVDGEFPEITWEHSHVVVDGEGDVLDLLRLRRPRGMVIWEHSKRLGQHTDRGAARDRRRRHARGLPAD